MNCPQCDSLMYKSECPCGWKVPEVSTIVLKRVDTVETSFPLPINEDLKNVSLTGKAYAKYCIDYAKKVLRGEKC